MCVIRAPSYRRYLFGLTSRSHTIVLDFRTAEERARFVSFVTALLPPTIRVAHASALDAAEAHGQQATRVRVDPTTSAHHAGMQAAGGGGGSPNAVGSLPPLDLPPPNPRASSGQHCLRSVTTAQVNPTPGLHVPELPAYPGMASYILPRRQSFDGTHSGDSAVELLSIFVGTWNMGNALPPCAPPRHRPSMRTSPSDVRVSRACASLPLAHAEVPLCASRALGRSSLDGWIPRESHDVYAVALQECADEHWLMALDAHLGPSYVRIAERRMGGNERATDCRMRCRCRR